MQLNLNSYLHKSHNMKKVKMILSPLGKLRVLIQRKPELSAMITGAIAAIILAIVTYFTSPMPTMWGSVCMITVPSLMFGAIIFFGTIFIYGEKQGRELAESAARSATQVMINQALINNGSITDKSQLVKL